MTLDPQIAEYLSQMQSASTLPLEAMTLEQARVAVAGLHQLQGAAEPVAMVQDLMVPAEAIAITIRVYVPQGQAPFPVLVFFHGGGWIRGTLDIWDTPCRRLTNATGCIVVSVDYRLAPEHPFPAPLEDAYAATCWVAEHASQLQADPSCILIGGDSSGGNLAAAVALMARDRQYPNLTYQLLLYPPTHFDFNTESYREYGEGYGLTQKAMRACWDYYLATPEDGTHPYASPLRASNLQGVAPACILTAEYDPLRDEAEAYAHRLLEAGVPVYLKRYLGMIHAFFHMAGISTTACQLFVDIGQIMQEAISQDAKHLNTSKVAQ